ncbi:MAG: hypothetical protein KUG82_10355 [Pseudomonadales bacterium]|nr:hypothetical protein [Pseudomonadales bacterium]
MTGNLFSVREFCLSKLSKLCPSSLRLLVAFVVLTAVNSANAIVIDIFEFSSYINADELHGDSLLDRQLNNGALSAANEFEGAGFGVIFDSIFDANGFGTATWTISNNSGMDLNNVQYFGFLDAEIDSYLNTYFNEYGDVGDLVLGAGSEDVLADSWEIDEPGFVFGDIFDNLSVGGLDNSNGVSVDAPDDVSLALGFDLGSLLDGESFGVSFEISEINNGGLGHFDMDSADGFYFNGFVVEPAISVMEPGSLALLFMGIVGICGSRRFGNRS